MKVIFNGMRVKGGKKFFGDKILMANNSKFGMSGLKPRWEMSKRYKENLIKPWSEFFNSTEPVF